MANKLKMQTENVVDRNIENIGKLFPNCITEVMKGYELDGKVYDMQVAGSKAVYEKAIDFDKLRQELSKVVIEGDEERYDFNWPDKKKTILLANSPTSKTLRPVFNDEKEPTGADSTGNPYISTGSVGKDGTAGGMDSANLYIEGDNLDVLKLLQETYMGKVKMIYIDPPYNTGNDFVYEDDFAMSSDEYLERSGSLDEEGNRLFANNESNGRFHTDWLNMIYPRLKIAKDLLTDDGVIFISIDDNEQANLKKICDEVFGASNCAGMWSWYKSATPPNLSYKIKKNLEYIFCYEKRRDNIKFMGLKKISPSNDPFTKPQNSYKDLVFPKGSIITKLPNGTYEKGVYGTNKFPNELKTDLIIKDGKNINDVIFYNRFIWVQETLLENINKNTLIYLSDNLVLSYKRSDYDNEVPPNYISDKIGSTVEESGKELTKLMDLDTFDYPKPVELLSYLLKFKNDKNALILDFFSGSATTAHAVMQLNAEDGGNRKFIMVQLPEVTDEKSEAYKTGGYKNICEIGKERIRRAGKKIKEENQMTAPNLDIGFRVLKLDSSNMKDVYYRAEEYSQNFLEKYESNIKEDRKPQDLLFQVMLDMGVQLSSKIEEKEIAGKKVFIVGEYSNDIQPNLIACFDNHLNNEVVTAIAKMKPLYAVFRDSSFASDSVATNFEQIFATYSPTTERKVI